MLWQPGLTKTLSFLTMQLGSKTGLCTCLSMVYQSMPEWFIVLDPCPSHFYGNPCSQFAWDRQVFRDGGLSSDKTGGGPAKLGWSVTASFPKFFPELGFFPAL